MTPRKRVPLLSLPDRIPALDVPCGQMSVQSYPGLPVSLQLVPPLTQSRQKASRSGLLNIVWVRRTPVSIRPIQGLVRFRLK